MCKLLRGAQADAVSARAETKTAKEEAQAAKVETEAAKVETQAAQNAEKQALEAQNVLQAAYVISRSRLNWYVLHKGTCISAASATDFGADAAESKDKS